jgi:hypothetical protein
MHQRSHRALGSPHLRTVEAHAVAVHVEAGEDLRREEEQRSTI